MTVYCERNPKPEDISMATTELVLGIQQLCPEAEIVPCPPYEDEHICLKVLVPFGVDICRKLERQITDLELTIQARYPVYTLALVLPKNST